LLAFNALLITVVGVLAVVAGFAWLIGRPLIRVVDKACSQIDEDKEARARRERLELEEEARFRAKAEEEIDSQFPNLREGQK
jgi:hypothetical protein